jgi:hypothetical protein
MNDGVPGQFTCRGDQLRLFDEAESRFHRPFANDLSGFDHIAV